jgi:hypothetical protein
MDDIPFFFHGGYLLIVLKLKKNINFYTIQHMYNETLRCPRVLK